MNGHMEDQLMEYMSTEVLRSLGKRADRGQESTGVELAQTANRALDRYFHLLGERSRRLKDSFTAGELALMCDACNGTAWLDAQSLKHLHYNIEDAVRLDKLDQKWEVDGAALVSKLKEMDLLSLFTLVDAIERFWVGPYYKANPDWAGVLA